MNYLRTKSTRTPTLVAFVNQLEIRRVNEITTVTEADILLGWPRLAVSVM